MCSEGFEGRRLRFEGFCLGREVVVSEESTVGIEVGAEAGKGKA